MVLGHREDNNLIIANSILDSRRPGPMFIGIDRGWAGRVVPTSLSVGVNIIHFKLSGEKDSEEWQGG